MDEDDLVKRMYEFVDECLEEIDESPWTTFEELEKRAIQRGEEMGQLYLQILNKRSEQAGPTGQGKNQEPSK